MALSPCLALCLCGNACGEMQGGSRFILIFAGLVPTMALVKATAMTMPSVQRTQQELANLLLNPLPPGFSSPDMAGLSARAHLPFFPPRCHTSSFERRRLSAMACLTGDECRGGMVTVLRGLCHRPSFTGAMLRGGRSDMAC